MKTIVHGVATWSPAGLALIFAAAGCGSSGQESAAAEAEDQFVNVVNVEVMTLTPREFTSYIRLTGEVEALNDVEVAAEESGVIERFFIEKGQRVERGAPIAKIRDDIMRAQVEEARAGAQLAAERFERQRQLWEEEKIGSEIAYLEARYQADLQAARLATLEARLARTTITAPIAGIFDARYVDAGEMVAPGTRVGRVVDVDRVKVTGGVAERFAASVERGDSARVRFDVLPERVFVGAIGYVGRAVDPESRTFPIEIVLGNPGRVIKPQMVASVEVADSRLAAALVVPQSAILRTEDGYQVLVAVERDGNLVAEARAVRVGPSYADEAVIESGLAAGERVIVRGHQLVEAGNRVRVVGAGEAR
jgi:RND family efflux transporter MFP subunit